MARGKWDTTNTTDLVENFFFGVRKNTVIKKRLLPGCPGFTSGSSGREIMSLGKGGRTPRN